VAEFTPFGGVSLELVAWELGVGADAVRDAWAEAEEAGLLEFVGVDGATGERLVRLSERGQRAAAGGGSIQAPEGSEQAPADDAAAYAELVESLSGLVNGAPVALVHWDRSARVLAWNRAAEEIFGWPAAVVVGRLCPILWSAGSESGMLVAEAVLAGEPLQDEEVQVKRGDGTLVDVSLSTRAVSDESGAVESVIGAAIDITERRRRMRQLRHLASHDPLTDLLNRRAFEQSLARVLERVRRGGTPGALLALDLDRFKQVNDRLGHLVGDALLIAVANVLRRSFRPGDLLARVGGDEFAIVLENIATGEAALIAERLRASIAEQRVGPDGRGRSTASIGGIGIDATIGLPELLTAADRALYLAKRRRDTTEVLTPAEVAKLAPGQASRETERLQEAIGLGALAVYYQGVKDLQSGALHSEEALARLRINGAFKPASEFVRLAERSGLITEIDTRITRIVIDRLATQAELRLSLNLSAASLGHPALLQLLREHAPSGGYAGRLIAEVRQPDLLADPVRALRFAEHAHSLGAAIAVDDLGIDYSALAILQAFPIALVKLDRLIVQNLTIAATSERVRETAHACARAGITFVAKGIEQAATLESLLSLGVTLGEGFLLDQPHVASAG
jgi:diguanylate cyclase (GGDEF)-like protein/PAS domain S-box-containing protein